MNENTRKIHPHSGEFVIAQLKRFGSDVNQKHEVSFWLYFPNEKSARNAARRVESSGLKVEVSPPRLSLSDSQWLCLFYCPHVPDEDLLNGISKFCTDIASEFDGEYDGWEARLELKDGENPTKVLDTISNIA